MSEHQQRDQTRFTVFLASVALHSVMATCDRLRTACGIVKEKRLRGVGYNGSVSGMSHCDEVGHVMEDNHCIATRHGEENAISNTDRVYLRGGQAIILGTPCFNCVKHLAQEGITRIDYIGAYANARGKEHIHTMAQQLGIEMHQHEIDWAELFQSLFDLLARKGGLLYRAGYRLKVVKEPLEEQK